MTDNIESDEKTINLSIINNSTDYNSDSSFLNTEDTKEKNLLDVSKGLNTLYGRDINIKNPLRIGNVFAMFYIKDQPMIIIGPHCK
jgi:hypothetical protein